MTDPLDIVEARLGEETWAGVEGNGHRPGAASLVPELALEPRILNKFGRDVRLAGIVGEEKIAKLLFLALTSRVLDRPVSVAVKGPSGAGKSFTTDRVLSFFPNSAYFERTAMSSRNLVYTRESFRHRFIVLFEAEGMGDEDDIGPYLIRSLLSEGRLLYEFVDKKVGETRLIDKPGPTGLILSTTAAALHPENETRMLSVTVTDTREQTKQVLRKLAADADDNVDRKPWWELQVWVEGAEHRVEIPFAPVLAELVEPVAVRLRRDFKAILNLIKAHAILHQSNRGRDAEGRIIAGIEDYEAVYDIVVDAVSEGIGVMVSDTIRETVAAVDELSGTYPEGVSLGVLAAKLDVDKSVASRRAAKARYGGYLQNSEDRRGRAARYQTGDPLPEPTKALPDPRILAASCSRATPATLQQSGEQHQQQQADAMVGADKTAGRAADSKNRCSVATVARDEREPLHSPVAEHCADDADALELGPFSLKVGIQGEVNGHKGIDAPNVSELQAFAREMGWPRVPIAPACSVNPGEANWRRRFLPNATGDQRRAAWVALEDLRASSVEAPS